MDNHVCIGRSAIHVGIPACPACNSILRCRITIFVLVFSGNGSLRCLLSPRLRNKICGLSWANFAELRRYTGKRENSRAREYLLVRRRSDLQIIVFTKTKERSARFIVRAINNANENGSGQDTTRGIHDTQSMARYK